MKKKKTLQEHFVVFENLIFFGIVLFFLARFFSEADYWWVFWLISLGCWIAAEVYRRKFIKCPHCGSRHIVAKCQFCPNCGKKLD